MPRESTSGLTCKAIKGLMDSTVNCCEHCHARVFRRAGHRLLFTSPHRVVENSSTAAYVCCTVNAALNQHEKKKLAPSAEILVVSCSDPACSKCGSDPYVYWSYQLQGWLHEKDYSSQLDLHHPYSYQHQCGAGSYNVENQTFIPEHRGWLCRLPSGHPTFGINYCANPFYIVVVSHPDLHLIAHLPEDDKLSTWVPELFISSVTKVIPIPVPF